MKRTLIALSTVFAMSAAFAQASPVGLWRTVDESTKADKSLVRISEVGGVFSGRIEKLLAPDAKPDKLCDKCTDDRKDKPLVGMTVIRDLKKSTDSDDLWEGGTILDPANGKTYKLRVKPVEGGKQLEVRGYIGAPLLGRTQTWYRVE